MREDRFGEVKKAEGYWLAYWELRELGWFGRGDGAELKTSISLVLRGSVGL